MKLSTLHNAILYKIVDFYLYINRHKASVVGPFNPKNKPHLFSLAVDFRKLQSISRAPYLFEKTQNDIEELLQLDERSQHFVLIQDEKIIAYIRLTPAPFELSALLPLNTHYKTDLNNYYEFSRFATDNSLTNKRFYALLLLLKAGHWLFSKKNAEGIVGICKSNRLSYFKHFHLLAQNQDAFSIDSRHGEYFYILGKKQHVLYSISRMLFSKTNNLSQLGKNYELRTVKKHP